MPAVFQFILEYVQRARVDALYLAGIISFRYNSFS